MHDHNQKWAAKTVIQLLVFVILVPLLPLLVSRRWDWWEAWVFAFVCIGGFVASRIIVARRWPDLIAERARFTDHKDTKSWDRILAPLVGLGSALIPLAAGLEALAGGTVVFSLPAKIFALALITAGYAFSAWALYENRFFSGLVRIQSDRSQQVVSHGPYRFIRHPGYAGALLTYFATPVLLEAPWAFVPAVFFAIVLVLRTSLEDNTLQDELEGYREYAQHVRFRLLPGIW